MELRGAKQRECFGRLSINSRRKRRPKNFKKLKNYDYRSENIEDYLAQVPEERREAIFKILEVFRKNIPAGFTEMLQYNMPGFSVSLEDYPAGYHCTPNTPLPFLSVGNQKNSINVYYMGMYMKPEILEWFQSEFPKHSKKKLDMGKSCIRFKKPEDIPYDLLGELVSKMSREEYISIYEGNLKRGK